MGERLRIEVFGADEAFIVKGPTIDTALLEEFADWKSSRIDWPKFSASLTSWSTGEGRFDAPVVVGLSP